MLASIFEGYVLTLLLLLHLSLFTCDQTCIFPLKNVRAILPRDALQIVGNFVSILHISRSNLQIIAQFLFIGDFFVVAILSVKLIDCFVKKFAFVFISLALSAFLLRRLEVI